MGTESHLLTTAAIDAALARSDRTGKDEWLPDSKDRNGGRLFFRAQPTGGRWYFRYTLPDGKRDALAMGAYAAPGRTKAARTGTRYTLQAARDEAHRLADMLKRPETANVRSTLAAQELAAERERRAQLDQAEAERRERESKVHTLAKLCEAYAAHLAASGKVSAAKVRADLNRHVSNHQTAKLPARDVTRREIAGLVRDVAENSGPRMAGVIRSYLSAAYALAMDAEGNPHAPAALLTFNVDANPVAGVKATATAARDRVLSVAELRGFLKRVRQTPGAVADALLACLLAGGQRPQQMLRATVAHFDSDTRVLQLSDRKGKRATPRVHVVPLARDGAAVLARRAKVANDLGSTFLFTSGGKVLLDIGTLSWRVTEISRAMVEAKEAQAPFQMKDLRRTVETMLAGAGVTRDVRAQLLSHGVSGVQDKHYDRHAYMDEKREALVQWERRLREIEKPSKARKAAA